MTDTPRDQGEQPMSPKQAAVLELIRADIGWMKEAPWPIYGECFERHIDGHSCLQCDGSHDHEWVAWHNPHPRLGVGPHDVPVRCKTCGGRKCDTPTCLLRRHHRGDHEHY